MSAPFNIDTTKVVWNKYEPKNKDGSLIPVNIRHFITVLYPITDCNPVGQRPAVYLNVANEKNVEIIQSILLGVDITQITLVKVSDTKYQYESLDGGHRKRAIKAYVDGLFKVNGKFYSEMSDEEMEKFLNYELTFTIYEPMSTFMKGYIFRNINKTTDVNNQENLNSYGDIAIANVIRQTVRPMSVNGKVTKIHDLFEVSASGNFKWIATDNLRLKLEEFVARYYYRFYVGGDIGSRVFEEVQTMYLDENVKVNKLKKEADSLFDFLLTMAECRKSVAGTGGLNWGEMNTLANLYLFLFAQYDDWSMDDPIGFYRAFYEVYCDFYHDVKGQHGNVVNFPFEKDGITEQLCFRNYAVCQNSYQKQEQMMKWVTGGFDVLQFITLKDPTRLFPKWMKVITLQSQGYVCAIDGLPLEWDDAEAAHIRAHVKGGKTILSNCAMVRKTHNSDMGTMDVTEYKEVYEKSIAA
jgi:hypothetical protein